MRLLSRRRRRSTRDAVRHTRHPVHTQSPRPPMNPPPSSSTRRSSRGQPRLLTVCTPLRRALRAAPRPSSDRAQLEPRSSPDRAQIELRPSSDRAQTELRPSSDRAQTELRPSSDRAQIEPRSSSDRAQIELRSSSGRAQVELRSSSDHHEHDEEDELAHAAAQVVRGEKRLEEAACHGGGKGALGTGSCVSVRQTTTLAVRGLGRA